MSLEKRESEPQKEAHHAKPQRIEAADGVLPAGHSADRSIPLSICVLGSLSGLNAEVENKLRPATSMRDDFPSYREPPCFGQRHSWMDDPWPHLGLAACCSARLQQAEPPARSQEKYARCFVS
jgi:hypothetical protein